MKTLTANENDTLDSLIFRAYGKTAGIVEQALEYNPELANHTILPMGTKVYMPDDEYTSAVLSSQTVQLWS